ncbi:MAG: response regulator [Gemmatimonadetes bacterium]|nr:response regulator [Gemmatimonadota bacterium]
MPRVLIVDDEAAIARALALALTRDGWACVQATSAEQAQARLREEMFDAMVLDLRLSDMRGDVLLHVAASLQPHLAERSLFMTGDISAKAEALIEATHCPFVRKPFDLADVLAVLRDMVPRREADTA